MGFGTYWDMEMPSLVLLGISIRNKDTDLKSSWKRERRPEESYLEIMIFGLLLLEQLRVPKDFAIILTLFPFVALMSKSLSLSAAFFNTYLRPSLRFPNLYLRSNLYDSVFHSLNAFVSISHYLSLQLFLSHLSLHLVTALGCSPSNSPSFSLVLLFYHWLTSGLLRMMVSVSSFPGFFSFRFDIWDFSAFSCMSAHLGHKGTCHQIFIRGNWHVLWRPRWRWRNSPVL